MRREHTSLVRVLVGAAVIVVLASAAVRGQAKPAAKSSQEGVWQFVETSIGGPQPRTVDQTKPGSGGILIISGRHFAYVNMLGETARPNLPQGGAANATADQLRATWGPFDAQAGTFETRGGESTIHAMVAKAPAAMDPSAFTVFSIKQEGNTLWLTNLRNQSGPTANGATFKLTRIE